MRTLQSLLLEAVAAAAPTITMPPAVTAAVDSIRGAMGLPPLAGASGTHLRVGDNSPPLSFTGGCVDSRKDGLFSAGYEPRIMKEQVLSADHDKVFSSQAAAVPSRRAGDGSPLPAVGVRPPVGESIPHIGAVEDRVAEDSDSGSIRRNDKVEGSDSCIYGSDGEHVETGAFDFSRRDLCEGGYDSSCARSEGSGNHFARVTPTDYDSEDEGVETGLGLPPYDTAGWRSRDEILRRYEQGSGLGANTPQQGCRAKGTRLSADLEFVSAVAYAGMASDSPLPLRTDDAGIHISV